MPEISTEHINKIYTIKSQLNTQLKILNKVRLLTDYTSANNLGIRNFSAL